MRSAPHDEALPHVVAIDYGSKRNIFRNLADAGARVTVLPATATFDEVMAHEPDGFFLSNGPGDPAATGDYAVPVIRAMLETGKPLFGICLGHQLLGLAVGARTAKMHQGHRGANHPVKRLADGRVEITSMNHGFAVEADSLPANARADPYQPVRRQPLRPRADRPAGVQRAISSRRRARGRRTAPICSGSSWSMLAMSAHAARQPVRALPDASRAERPLRASWPLWPLIRLTPCGEVGDAVARHAGRRGQACAIRWSPEERLREVDAIAGSTGGDAGLGRAGCCRSSGSLPRPAAAHADEPASPPARIAWRRRHCGARARPDHRRRAGPS